jgi:hypothetical protein
MTLDAFVEAIQNKLAEASAMLIHGRSTDEAIRTIQEAHSLASRHRRLIDGHGGMSIAEISCAMEESGVQELHIVRKENGPTRGR